MLFFRKLLKLPGPKDIGKSDHNHFLPSRDFSPDCTDYCWEDWHVDVKKLHPIKYFLAETTTDFIRHKIWYPIIRPIEDARYFIVSHIIPSRRYHMLDLRQPNNKKYDVDQYRYGWRDTPELMLFAIFNLLDNFVKNELPHCYTPSEEDVLKEPGLKSQRDMHLEILAIHKWWIEDRKEEYKRFSDLRTTWYKKRKARDPGAERYYKRMRKKEDAFEEKTDEMLNRLMKVRRALWS